MVFMKLSIKIISEIVSIIDAFHTINYLFVQLEMLHKLLLTITGYVRVKENGEECSKETLRNRP